MTRLAMLLFLVSTTASASTDWKLLVVRSNGETHTSNPMSRHDCEFARDRVLGRPATREEKAKAKAAADNAEREAAEVLAKAPLCVMGNDGKLDYKKSDQHGCVTITNGKRAWEWRWSDMSEVTWSYGPSVYTSIAECFQ